MDARLRGRDNGESWSLKVELAKHRIIYGCDPVTLLTAPIIDFALRNV